MDTNNTNGAKPTKRTTGRTSSDATPMPRWHEASSTGFETDKSANSPSGCSLGYDFSQSSSRKLYLMLTGWAILLSLTVTAAIKGADGHFRIGETNVPLSQTAFARSESADSSRTAASARVELLKELTSSMPSSFRDRQTNAINHPERMQPVVEILAHRTRPLRVLHLGDSHVAGRTFPTTLKETLQKYLGVAGASAETPGIEFSYIGSNGATTKRFMTDSYMNRIADKLPDLLIVSLGTNEAHGMGYREEQHRRELDAFFARLRKAAPDATILLTTPPGDYLTSSYINYRKTSRSSRRVRQVSYSKRPNPMSSRCARLISEYGEDNGMPVWDLFSICGGEQSAQRNWVSGHYMRPDRIHFEHAGYAVHGKLLGEAIAKAVSGQ